jgi:hypothetical protein
VDKDIDCRRFDRHREDHGLNCSTGHRFFSKLYDSAVEALKRDRIHDEELGFQ